MNKHLKEVQITISLAELEFITKTLGRMSFNEKKALFEKRGEECILTSEESGCLYMCLADKLEKENDKYENNEIEEEDEEEALLVKLGKEYIYFEKGKYFVDIRTDKFQNLIFREIIKIPMMLTNIKDTGVEIRLSHTLDGTYLNFRTETDSYTMEVNNGLGYVLIKLFKFENYIEFN